MRFLGGTILTWAALAGAAWADETALRIGDPERGAEVFQVCAECHQVGKGAEHGTGPHLNGIFDRKVAQFEDFEYSAGIIRARRAGMVWDLEHLDAYLTNPKTLVSGTNMEFAGLSDPKDRGDVLAYLRQFSANPQNIPEAAPTALKQEVELSPEVLAMVGDPEYGEYLATECTTCHQLDGDYDGIPVITGWLAEDFVLAMHAYKQKIRPHPVMQMMAGRLSDEEIAALAAYFGALE
ncbi:c-type cytochrome [Ruegeria marina]|uniref:Sulfide dehydrogenase (Flavocytochrome c), cytochrome c subunit n=1 Tax=Ruegeria marina TaxID=639004 RepID=A0A1G6S097_9RHOB|nr:c-type cytochrome [Ruegeria marina]SDD10091.1 sulfide dehydrogenase (flavocytochrome c), cytochrome c subunit [Ruegeria marina]